MFDRLVEVKVLNAKKVIRDALIGSFKVGPVSVKVGNEIVLQIA